MFDLTFNENADIPLGYSQRMWDRMGLHRRLVECVLHVWWGQGTSRRRRILKSNIRWSVAGREVDHLFEVYLTGQKVNGLGLRPAPLDSSMRLENPSVREGLL